MSDKTKVSVFHHTAFNKRKISAFLPYKATAHPSSQLVLKMISLYRVEVCLSVCRPVLNNASAQRLGAGKSLKCGFAVLVPSPNSSSCCPAARTPSPLLAATLCLLRQKMSTRKHRKESLIIFTVLTFSRCPRGLK